jgi:hypothetical protein
MCFVSLNVYGQRKEISREEFLDAYKKAGEKIKTIAFRITIKNELYRGNEWEIIQSDVADFVPPDRRHTITEVTAPNGKKIFIERILIGNDDYKRENGGNWIKRTSNTTNQQQNNPIKTVENDSKFYLTENIQFNNQTANLYEVLAEYKITTPIRATHERKETISYRKEKRWISRDGLLLKMEMEDEFQGTQKSNSRRTWIYEYDASIKIEAPIK